MTNHPFLSRLVGAAVLNAKTYEEVEADRGANTQAFAVVVLSSVAAGIGVTGLGEADAATVAFFGVVALLAWATWALVTYQIGMWILPAPQTRADIGELLRTTGFATAPGLLRIVGVIPGLTTLVFAATAVWMLLAMVMAVRQALDFPSTKRALAVCGIGWALSIALALAAGFFFGPRVS